MVSVRPAPARLAQKERAWRGKRGWFMPAGTRSVRRASSTRRSTGASTILYPTMAAYEGRHERRYTTFAYGIHGTPTTVALAEALAELSGGARTLLLSSGLVAGDAGAHRRFSGGTTTS